MDHEPDHQMWPFDSVDPLPVWVWVLIGCWIAYRVGCRIGRHLLQRRGGEQ